MKKEIVYIGNNPAMVRRFFYNAKTVNYRYTSRYERLANEGKVFLIVESPYDKYLHFKLNKSGIKGNIAVAKNNIGLISILTYLMKR